MSVANFGFQAENQFPSARAVSTATVNTLAMNNEGQTVVCYTNVTAVAVLTALSTPTFSPGCLVICVNSNAANSVRLLYNGGTAAAPSFTGYIS